MSKGAATDILTILNWRSEKLALMYVMPKRRRGGWSRRRKFRFGERDEAATLCGMAWSSPPVPQLNPVRVAASGAFRPMPRAIAAGRSCPIRDPHGRHGTGSVGWIADLRQPRGERLERAESGHLGLVPPCSACPAAPREGLDAHPDMLPGISMRSSSLPSCSKRCFSISNVFLAM